MRYLMTLLFALVLAQPLQAQGGYDGLPRVMRELGAEQVQTGGATSFDVFGDWLILRSMDEFTDETRLLGMTQEEGGKLMSVRCRDGDLSYIVTHSFYAGDGDNRTSVTHRVDRGRVYEERWTLIPENTGSYTFPDRSHLREMANGSSFVIEVVDPFDGERTRMRFSLRGSARVFEEILEKCPRG